MITAEVIQRSAHIGTNNELVTFVLKYPRFIHSEFMTHRCFSRNAASSRAVPVHKFIEAVRTDPATPEYWGSNKPGMQAGEELVAEDLDWAKQAWYKAGIEMTESAQQLVDIGCHKQIANRTIEPFLHITVIATTGKRGLDNFFALRANKMAQPEFQVLAYRMLDAYMKAQTAILEPGEWHIPFSRPEERDLIVAKQLAAATGRIARVSYLKHDGAKSTTEEDIELHDKLMSSGHWSPFEHCAMAMDSRQRFGRMAALGKGVSTTGSNLGPGWLQYRKTFEDMPKQVDLVKLAAEKPDWITL